LQSTNFDGLGFPDLYFFQPKSYFLKGNQLEIQYLNLCDEVEEDFENIVKSQKSKVEIEALVTIQQRIRELSSKFKFQ
jgi:para-aminobenzoate synthetase component 1